MIKSGYTALIGKPNAGKSTLMNAMLDFKLSAVNPKVQTTRNKILGILTGKDHQIIFMDTPGLLEPKYEMQKFMMKEIKSSFKEADVIVYILDAQNINLNDVKRIEDEFRKDFRGTNRIVVLNKVDLIPQENVQNKMIELRDEFGFNDIIPVSAKNNYNLDTLKARIIELLPEGDFYFDADTLTNKPEKFFVSEIIRENILTLYKEEIPYSVFVDVREFKVRDLGQKDYINADIILERESQKIIILGKNGEMVKKLGEMSRKGIEEFLGKEVFLKLFVKVRKDWRRDFRFLKSNF
ncbi:MAG TPA: GTPase Era [Ignavibacteria bacterium]|nr:GTPase Era [Ignavibacteria bacterium]